MPTADCMVIAHRGASSYAPENTLVAFDLALQMGCRHLELDVDITRDGQIVVMHDEMVDRTTNGTGPVGSHTLAELWALDAGAWCGAQFAGERVPTLAEVLDRYQGRRACTPSSTGVRHTWCRVRQTWYVSTAWWIA